MPPQRSRASETRNVRLPRTCLAWACSPVGTIQRRRGKRPAATGSTRSQNACITDRHLQRCDPRTHGGTRSNLPERHKCRKRPDEPAGLPAAICKMPGSRLARALVAARAIPLGSLPARSGRSGPGPKDEDHQLDHHWQAQWSRRAHRRPRRPHAVVNRAHACAAR